MSIKVDDLSTWPDDVLGALSSPAIRRRFEREEWVDDVYEDPGVQEVGAALVRHCYRSGLIGYHCTKEKYPGFFREHGLEPTEPERRIEAFLDEFGGLLSENKLREVRTKFDEWLSQRGQMRGRRDKVWFCLTRNAVVGPGTERFFRYYGGEIIYWPFSGRDGEVEALLESIGSPVVVELSLDPSELEYFGDWNLAKSMLSYYGLSVNPSFNPHDIEGYMKVPLPPERIVQVYPQADFFEANKQITPA
jgi:hypothetical protein